MPRSFDMATEYNGTPAQVHEAFREREYWEARLAESGADHATLDGFTIGSDGGIDVVSTQVLRADRLPAVIHQFHRGDLIIRRAETWTALSGDTAQGSVSSSVQRAPVTLTGRAVLGPDKLKARLSVRATVEVRIPLVGGKMEKFIGAQLMALLTNEQRFTTRWIAQNH